MKYICENCGKEFTEDYRSEWSQKHGGEPRFCSKECSYKFRTLKGSGYLEKQENLNLHCKYCNKECKNLNSLRNHERLCKSNPNRQHIECWTHNEKWRNSQKNKKESFKKKPINFIKGEFKCRYCGKISPYEHSCHIHEKYCKENPNREIKKGRPHTEEEKRKLSVKQKENFKDGHSRYPFTRAEDSYPEKYFMKWLDEFTTYEHNYHVDRYFLDFAWPKDKTYIEVNGNQHYETEKAIQHDKERFKILESLGWNCISTINWSSYQTLTKKEQSEFLNNLKSKIR